MGRKLYHFVDTVIFLICVPFYLVVIPLMLIGEYFAQRRKVHLDLEITHMIALDVREDYWVVDVSRIVEGLVGIRRRTWFVQSRDKPAYPEEVEFIPVKRFWVPNPLTFRSGAR